MWMSCHRAEHEGTHMSAQSLSPLLLSPSPLSLSPVVAVLGAPCWCCRSVWAAAQQRQAPRLWPWCSSPADRHQLEGGTQGATAAVRRTTAAWALASLDPSESRNIIARFSGCFLEEAQDSGGQWQREVRREWEERDCADVWVLYDSARAIWCPRQQNQPKNAVWSKVNDLDS